LPALRPTQPLIK